MKAQGNVHVLSNKQSFPRSPHSSLGAYVVWFISLNCQLMNGALMLTATHTQAMPQKRKAPKGDHHRGSLILIRRESKGNRGLTDNVCCPWCGCAWRYILLHKIRITMQGHICRFRDCDAVNKGRRDHVDLATVLGSDLSLPQSNTGCLWQRRVRSSNNLL